MKKVDSSNLIGVVDGDVLVYRAGFAAEKKSFKPTINPDEYELVRDVAPESHAIQNLKTVLKELNGLFKSTEVYLSGKNNFRKEIATIKPYKGNRSEFGKPVHYNALRDYLVKQAGAIIVDGVEADDALGVRATSGDSKDGCKFCIVTNDKDLRQIPGWHYNWIKKEWENVNERESMRVFYRQLLTGDITDNIVGVEGIGPVGAANIVNPYTKESGMWQVVLAEYLERYPDGFHGLSVKNALLELGQLLWIQRTNRIKWEPPK